MVFNKVVCCVFSTSVVPISTSPFEEFAIVVVLPALLADQAVVLEERVVVAVAVEALVQMLDVAAVRVAHQACLDLTTGIVRCVET